MLFFMQKRNISVVLCPCSFCIGQRQEKRIFSSVKRMVVAFFPLKKRENGTAVHVFLLILHR